MKQIRKIRFVILSCIAATWVVAGCGTEDQGVKVAGQVFQDGQPIKFLPSEDITIGFSEEIPAGQKPLGFSGVVQSKDGAFVLSGPGGKGVAPGKYRISLSSQVYGGTGKDRFEALFSSKKPPLIADVGPEKGQTFIIDVGKWTVQKQ